MQKHPKVPITLMGILGTSLPETAHFVYCNGLDIWHSFQDITHNKGNNDRKSTILNLVELL